MIQIEWSDLLWLGIPIVLQATEHAAATAHLASQQAALISTQSVIQQPKQYVPFVKARAVFMQTLYFVPTAISRTVTLTIQVSKGLVLKVFGIGQ